MAEFDPDAYLAKKPEFDPDAYLSGQGASQEGWNKLPSNVMLPRGAAQRDIADLQAMDPKVKETFAADVAPVMVPSPAGLLGKIAVGAGSGAMQYTKQDNENAGLATALGAGIPAFFGGIGKAGSKLADYLMQKAANVNKGMPGVGTSLIEQGVKGTKSQMLNQAEQKIAQREAELSKLGRGLEPVETAPLAEPVREMGNRFKLSTGEVPANVRSEYNLANKWAGDIENLGGAKPAIPPTPRSVSTQPTGLFDEVGKPLMKDVVTEATQGSPAVAGKLSMEDLLKLKRQGDYVGYANSGNPATSFEAGLGRAQGTAARKAVSEMTQGAADPILKKEQALILAKKGLDRPESLESLNPMGLFTKYVPGSNLGLSVGSRIPYWGGKLSDALANTQGEQAAKDAYLLYSLFANSPSEGK